MIRQAVILAGGKGTRLASRLGGRPKSLVDIDGQPLLARQLDALRDARFLDVLVLVQHAKDQIEEFVAGYDAGLMTIRLIEDGEPKGTGGCVLAAWEQLAERFLVIYGDTLFDIDLARFIARHCEAGADATLFVHPNDHPYDSDLVGVDDRGWVSGFHPAPHPPGHHLRNLVNAALYAVQRDAIAAARHFTTCDFVKDIFPAMLDAGRRILAYSSFEYIKDIGTPDRLDVAVGHLRTGKVARSRLSHPQQAIFFDRDGTLNVERGLVLSPAALELDEGAGRAVRAVNESGYRAIVVTNQPVVARGDVSPEGLARIHARLETDLGRERAYLDEIYVCPHHPDRGFDGEVATLKIACACRKPAPGLLLDAARDFNIDLAASWIVGDSARDVLAGQAAGVSTVQIGHGLGHEGGRFVADPDFRVANIVSAVRLILDVYPRLAADAAPILQSIGPGTLVLVSGSAGETRRLFAGVVLRELRLRGHAAARLHIDALISSASTSRADEILVVEDPRAFAWDGATSRPIMRLEVLADQDDLAAQTHPPVKDFGVIEVDGEGRPLSAIGPGAPSSGSDPETSEMAGAAP